MGPLDKKSMSMAIINRMITESYDSQNECVVNTLNISFLGINVLKKQLKTSHNDAVSKFKETTPILYRTNKIGFKHE